MFGEGGRQERRKEEGKERQDTSQGRRSIGQGPHLPAQVPGAALEVGETGRPGRCEPPEHEGLRQLRVTSGTRSRICQIPRPQRWGKGVLLGLGWPFLLFLLDLAQGCWVVAFIGDAP